MTLAYRVGLTGGIGSGKTTVCELFSKLDVPIIDTDIISREIVQAGSQGLEAIVSQFGDSVLNPNNTLDRSALRRLVFDDPEKLQALNSILHPLIYQQVKDEVSIITNPYCIISIPLLFETGGEKYVDRVLVIDTTVENQLTRSSKRDEVAPAQIMKIIEKQMDRVERTQRADDIITNNGDLNQLAEQVKSLHRSYLKRGHTSTSPG